MAKLIPCPACKKQISIDAATCPKCGQPITDDVRNEAVKKQKKRAKGCLWIIIAFCVLSAIGNFMEKKKDGDAPSTQPSPAAVAATPTGGNSGNAPSAPSQQAVPSFPLTAEQFLMNFNNASQKVNPSKQATIVSQDKEKTLISISGRNEVLIATDAQGNVTVAVYHGDPIDMAYAIAGVKPEWPNTRRGEVLRRLGIGDKNGAQKADAVVDGVRFHSFIKETGLLLTITPEN